MMARGGILNGDYAEGLEPIRRENHLGAEGMEQRHVDAVDRNAYKVWLAVHVIFTQRLRHREKNGKTKWVQHNSKRRGAASSR